MKFMKNVKQKQQTLQTLIDQLQAGGGGTVDAYTKAEADAKFQTLAGMSGYVPVTDNYMTVNGIRIYVSATEPTGTIPEGSIWIGG